MHRTSLLHITGLSRLSSISCPSHHEVYIEKLSAHLFVLAMLVPYPLYTTAAPRLERVTSTRLVVAPTIPTLLGNRFYFYFVCHHYLQRGNFGMPRIPTRLRGLKTALVNELQQPGIPVPENQRVIQTLLNGIVSRVESTLFQHDPFIVVGKLFFHSITLLF